MDKSPDQYFQRRIEVTLKAEGLIGREAWSLLSSYGRIMDGPHSGSYVSGVPFFLQLGIVGRLVSGETVPVHLMHRHRPGDHEASWLRWSHDAGLVMVFRNREEKG